MQERKKIPIINETKHYFSIPPLDAGWYDEVAKDGIDKKELNYIRYGISNYIYVKATILFCQQHILWIT